MAFDENWLSNDQNIQTPYFVSFISRVVRAFFTTCIYWKNPRPLVRRNVNTYARDRERD